MLGLTSDDPVPERTAVEQIGGRHIERLIQLNQWLYSPDEPNLECFQPTFRSAPSIVVRSECELFGVSAPRFAFRTYLSKGSFVNARRLEVLATVASREWAMRVSTGPHCVPNYKPFADVKGSEYGKPVADVIREGSCLADAIFVPPDRFLANRYRVLTIESGRIYGESLTPADELVGTPYLKSMKLGGGLCAKQRALWPRCFSSNSREGFTASPKSRALQPIPSGRN